MKRIASAALAAELGHDTDMLEGSGGNITIVAGRDGVGGKADLRDYRAMLVAARDRVEKLIRDGRSIDDAVAAKPLADIDAKIGANDQASGNFIRVGYRSLKPAAR